MSKTTPATLALDKAGVAADFAVDGVEAAARAAEQPFDMILMDLRMPELDGIGALRRIRSASGPNDTTPIVAFTADVTVETKEILLQAGFQDVVAKPIEPGVLIAALVQSASGAYAPAFDRQDEERGHAG